jgi:hypothetical protein
MVESVNLEAQGIYIYGLEVRSLFAMGHVYKHLIIAQNEHTAGCSIVGRS